MANAASASLEFKYSSGNLIVRENGSTWRVVANLYLSNSPGNRVLTVMCSDGSIYHMIVPIRI